METQTMARDATPAPGGVVSIQALSHTTLDGARSVFNTFVRTSNKRLCFGMCPACDEPADRFDNIFHEDPSRLRTAAVAVRMRDGKVLGAIVCCAHGQKRTREERLMEPDPGIGESHVEWLAVLPEERGVGMGTDLMKWSYTAVKSLGATSMKLTVLGGNRARVLYERQGFARVGPNGCANVCVFGCVGCCLLGCPYRDPRSTFNASEMVKTL